MDRLSQNNNKITKIRENLKNKGENKERAEYIQEQNARIDQQERQRLLQKQREQQIQRQRIRQSEKEKQMDDQRRRNHYTYNQQSHEYMYKTSNPPQGNEPSKIDIKKYQVGNFSKFAKKIQTQINQNEKFIRDVIKEAVYSYQMQIKENLKIQKGKLELQAKQKTLLELFDNSQDNLKQFLDNQFNFTWQALKAKKYNFKDTITDYISRKLTLRKVAIVDGKILQISSLKIQERFYHQKYLYLPTTVNNLYVRLDSSGNLTKVNFLKGEFLDLQGVKKMNSRMQEQILGMVLLYLKDQGVFIQIDQHHQIASQINRLTTLIAKNK